ncbi:hypothetical protein [Staphylococcus saprophyticus]|uniref:hypothetical protein n=1 Tax=Staphylococcus saprophyticus TaxID=29385 RepID=UPI0030BF64D0
MNQTLGDMRKEILANYNNANKGLLSQSNYLSSIGKQLKNTNALEMAKTARQLKYNNAVEWAKINQKQLERTFNFTSNVKINQLKNLSASIYLNNKNISNINGVLNNGILSTSFKPIGLYNLNNINRDLYNIKAFGQFKEIANIVNNYSIDINRLKQSIFSDATQKYILKNSVYNSEEFIKAANVIKNIAHQTFDVNEDITLNDENEQQSLLLYFLFRINENIKICSSITRDIGIKYTACDFLEDNQLYLPSFIFVLLSIVTNALTHAVEDKYEPYSNEKETKSIK